MGVWSEAGAEAGMTFLYILINLHNTHTHRHSTIRYSDVLEVNSLTQEGSGSVPHMVLILLVVVRRERDNLLIRTCGQKTTGQTQSLPVL